MIVVADDLGADADRNAAIAKAFDAGLVDAASLLVNGPGFEEAGTLARPYAERVGVHLVLTEGVPLTDEIRRLLRFCDADGRFRLWRGQERALWLSRRERLAVARELRAQIARARAAGFGVSHLDSHHHVHTEPALVGVVVALARELGVPRVRLARNCGPGMGPAIRAWKTLHNANLRRAGLAGTRWFGNVDDFLHLRAGRRDCDSFEAMVHPVIGRDGGVEDDERPTLPLVERIAPLRSSF